MRNRTGVNGSSNDKIKDIIMMNFPTSAEPPMTAIINLELWLNNRLTHSGSIASIADPEVSA